MYTLLIEKTKQNKKNQLYPVEYNDEIKRKEKSDGNDADGDIKRPRRETAIIGKLKRRYANGNWNKLLRHSTVGGVLKISYMIRVLAHAYILIMWHCF